MNGLGLVTDGLIAGGVSSGSSDCPTVTEIVSGLLNTALAGYTTGGTVGAALNRITVQGPWIRAQAYPNFAFPMLALTTGAKLAGLTVTAQRKLDDGTLEPCTNAVRASDGDYYAIDFATDDTDGVFLIYEFTATGARPTIVHVNTIP